MWAVAAIVIWLPLFTGEIEIPTAFSARDWHIHEMIFGYGSAVVAGFLLTAIPNWTGRLPVAGLPLILLCAL
ncbi:MAG TPA: NnrS family protein, partial [Hyphomicrobium sp.]|nr:NnrS family protein [Hyphomicrobium sp.]